MANNEAVARWWAEDFSIDGKREQFYAALVRYLDEHPDIDVLEVDYDPSPPLIHVLSEIGVECRGFSVSAKDIFYSRKTRSILEYDEWLAKGGYGFSFHKL